MNYYINFSSPYATSVYSVYEIIKSRPYLDINECLNKAEHLFYSTGCKYVQVVNELGDIYTEFEF
jgi:hypothetical protein